MKTRRATVCIVSLGVVCLVLAGVVVIRAETISGSKCVMEGLPGVYVLVEGIDENVKDTGITTDSIQTKVELRLRSLGIKVLSRAEHFNISGRPYLYVNVNAMVSSGSCSYNISVELHEDVRLVRNGALVIGATTWGSGGVGIGSTSGAAEFISEKVLENVDKFANDYLAANPKK